MKPSQPPPPHWLEMKGARSKVRHVFDLSIDYNPDAVGSPLSACSLLRSANAELVTTSDELTRPCKRCASEIESKPWYWDEPREPQPEPAWKAQHRQIEATLAEIDARAERIDALIDQLKSDRSEYDDNDD